MARNQDLNYLVIPSNTLFYIDSSRIDSYTEDGSYPRPFKTLAAAVAAATANTQLIVLAGSYGGNHTLPNDIGVQGLGRNSVEFTGNIITGSGGFAAENIKFSGSLTINGTYGLTNCIAEGGVTVFNDGSIQGGFISRAAGDALTVSGGNHNITGCPVTTSTGRAVVHSAGSLTIQGSDLANNDAAADTFVSTGGRFRLFDSTVNNLNASGGSISGDNGALVTAPNVISLVSANRGVFLGTSFCQYFDVNVGGTLTGTNIVLRGSDEIRNDSSVLGLLLSDAVETLDSSKANASLINAANGIAALDSNGDLVATSIPIDDVTPSTVKLYSSSKIATDLGAKEDAVNKGIANGYAPLDAGGKVPSTYLPGLALGAVDTAANQTAHEAIANEVGDVVIRTDTGDTYLKITNTQPPSIVIANDYKLIESGTAVTSVNGEVGPVVVLDTGDIAENGNLYYTDGRFDLRFATKTTTELSEGTNLYYTTARFNGDFDTRFGTKSTSDLTEGTNLYYTDGRFDTRFGTKTTDDLPQGSTNLYYTAVQFNGDFDTRFATKTTSDLTEGSNEYFTNARADGRIAAASVNDLSDVNITLTANRAVRVNGAGSGLDETTFTLPIDNGSVGQFLQTDGAGGTSWATASGGGGGSSEKKSVTSQTANYTATTSDCVILVNASSGAVTITLPTAASAFNSGKGNQFIIKKTDSTPYPVNVVVDSSGTMDGQTTLSITEQYDTEEVISNGSEYSRL